MILFEFGGNEDVDGTGTVGIDEVGIADEEVEVIARDDEGRLDGLNWNEWGILGIG